MSLEQELYTAYADCHMKDFEKALKIRNLDWIGAPATLDQAYNAFIKVCKHYNNFDCEQVFLQLKKICEGFDVVVSPAREGSPAIYLYCQNEQEIKAIFNKLKKDKSMYIDELNIRNDTVIRMWWD